VSDRGPGLVPPVFSMLLVSIALSVLAWIFRR
jgi:hypothetical protein